MESKTNTRKDQLKVKIKDFEQLKTVGLGSFGRVRLCRHKKTNKIYVMKILKKYLQCLFRWKFSYSS